MPEHADWQRTSPFAILFFLGKIVRMIMKNAWQSIAPLFVYISVGKEDLVTKLTIGSVAIIMMIILGAILSWWFFRYQIRDDSALIRSGIFKKKQLDIKFNRIQAVNTTQNPVFRALGLVTITFDTAGSSGSEGNLPAVTRPFADALRENISGHTQVPPGDDEKATSPATALIKLGWRDMIRIGLADRRALILFALIGPLMEQMGDQIEDFVEQALQSAVFNALQLGLTTGVLIIAVIILATFLLFAMISIAAAFLRYHNFELFLDGQTLRSRGGLFTTHEHSMELQKIQTLRLQQGIVQKWLNRFTMTARQAISGRQQSSQKTFSIPVVTAEVADQLRQLLLAPEAGRLSQNPRSEEFKAISPYYMRSRILFVGFIPAMLATALLYGQAGAIGLFALLWLPLICLATWQNWKRAGYLHDDDEIVRRSGLFGYRTAALLFRKVQRVTVLQSRYQRRKNLASLRIHMASGSVRVPYIEYATAQQLRDYILFRVETSQRVWH